MRILAVTRSEAVALLSALELSPFEDEVLEQKLLDVVYSTRSLRSSGPHPSDRLQPTPVLDRTQDLSSD